MEVDVGLSGCLFYHVKVGITQQAVQFVTLLFLLKKELEILSSKIVIANHDQKKSIDKNSI